MLERIAASKNCKTGQVALAWLHAQGDDIFPIPGTKRRTYLKENIESLQVSLSADELSSIDRVSAQVQGKRKNAAGMEMIDQ